jgi:hypothetical protein
MLFTKQNLAAITILALVVYGSITLRQQAMGHYLSTQRYQDIYYLPPAEWLPIFSQGYKKALADLIWMKALIYFGEEISQRGNVIHLHEYAEAILALDKYFKPVYRWAAGASLYRTGEITVADGWKAVDFLKRGMRLFPNDGEMAWDLGATYLFELAPMIDNPSEKARVKREAIPYLEAAAFRGAGPPWIALVNATNLEKLGQTEQAIRHLEALYSTTFNPDARQQIEKRLAALRTWSYVEAMKHAVREFEIAHQHDFPYLSQTLYLLVGQRPPLDEARWLLGKFDPVADTVVEDENAEN